MQKLPEDSVKLLCDLGLTETQAKVFVAVTKLGPSTVSEISRMSGIRREEVYRVLPNLEHRGLVQRILGKPLQIKVPDVKTAISLLIQHEQRSAKARIAQLADRATELFALLQDVAVDERNDVGVDEFSLIQEKEAVYSTIASLLSHAHKSINIVQLRPNLLWLLAAMSDHLRDACDRGAKIQIITTPPRGHDKLVTILERRFLRGSPIELKYMVTIHTHYIIIDDCETCIVTSGATRLPRAHLLWSRDENLLSLLQEDFYARWHASAHWMTIEGISISEPRHLLLRPEAEYGHTLLVYNSRSIKNRIIIDRIRQCVEDGFSVVYVCATSSRDDVISALNSADLGVSDMIDRGQFTFRDFTEMMSEDGVFTSETAIDFWENLYYELIDAGFNGLLGIAELQYFLTDELVENLLSYEHDLHRMIESDMEMICVYPSEALLRNPDPIDLFHRLFEAHSTILTEKHSSMIHVID